MDTDGKVLEGATSGNLWFEDSWPGQMRTAYGDHQRFIDTYFVQYPGTYFNGDGCCRDEDGYYWITALLMMYYYPVIGSAQQKLKRLWRIPM